MVSETVIIFKYSNFFIGEFLLKEIWKKSFYNEAYLKIDLFRKEKLFFEKKNSKGSKLAVSSDQRYISVSDTSFLTLASNRHFHF